MVSSWFERLRNELSTRISPRIKAINNELMATSKAWSHRKSIPQATARSLGVSLAGLNLDAARRQATLGKGYSRSPLNSKQLRRLQNSTVTLPPHKSWQGDYTDWEADPFNDRNWRFQFHTLRWINPYLWDAIDGSESSQNEWKRIVCSWAQANTPPDDAADEYAWKDMTDGNRAIQISIGAPLIDIADDWYLDLLVVHRNWLFDDRNIVEGNHGLHQNLGLFVVSAVLNETLGMQRAIERLGAQVLDAFDEKGLNEEGSVGYHQMNLIWWHQAEQRLKLEGHSLPPLASERLKKAGRTLGYLLLPDGTMPQIGDGGRGKARDGLHPFLDQVNAGEIREQGTPTFQHYPNGFTVMRSGWGETRPFKQESHTIVRHGRDLLRHSHNDRGSVHIYTAGRRWITDGGFHSYQQNDPARIYTKSRLAHNLVDIPNQFYNETGDVPAVLTEQTDEIHSTEILDENFEAASWQRRVVFLPQQSIWVIWDRVNSDKSDVIQQQWLFDLGLNVTEEEDNTVELSDETQKLRMQWMGDAPQYDVANGNLKSESKRGFIGVRWKEMQPTKSLHTLFKSKNLESIVVISDPEQHSIAELTAHKPMRSFELTFRDTRKEYVLDFQEKSTLLSTRPGH